MGMRLRRAANVWEPYEIYPQAFIHSARTTSVIKTTLHTTQMCQIYLYTVFVKCTRHWQDVVLHAIECWENVATTAAFTREGTSSCFWMRAYRPSSKMTFRYCITQVNLKYWEANATEIFNWWQPVVLIAVTIERGLCYLSHILWLGCNCQNLQHSCC